MWECDKCKKQIEDDEKVCYYCGDGINPNYDKIIEKEEKQNRKIYHKWITTSNNFEGYRIEEYIGPINTNVVLGINIFSDLLAGLTDIFGGRSNNYENKMDEIYQDCYEILRTKASMTNANAIIGLKIDFDEISGKGKSMIMISMIGTAVKIVKEIEN